MTYLTSPDSLPVPDNYAEPADTPAALRALADATQTALNTAMRKSALKSGIKSVTVRKGQVVGSGAVVFGVVLPTPVRVMATARSTTGVWNATVQDVTAEGCTINARNVADATFSDDTVVVVEWLAIGGLG